MPISTITAGDIRRFISDPQWQPGTRRNILRVLSMVMDSAVLDNLIRATPVKAARTTVRSLLRTERNGDLPFLSPVQVAQLAEEVGPTYKMPIYTAAYTGLRSGELAALRVRHLDLLHKTVRVEESVSDIGNHLSIVKPKNGKTQTVSMPSILVGMLEEQIQDKGEDEFVFGGIEPLRHGNFYGRHFRPAVRRLVGDEDIPEKNRGQQFGAWPAKLASLRFHDLRHTAASILIRNGEHLKAVSDWLGHSSITITADFPSIANLGLRPSSPHRWNREFRDR